LASIHEVALPDTRDYPHSTRYREAIETGYSVIRFLVGGLPPLADEEVQYNKARGGERDEENAQQRDVRPPERLCAQSERREDRCRRDVKLNTVLRRTHESD
jgi:hypothetical protein